MGAQLRVLRRRIKTVQSTKKITKAMELIATSRIAKAQARVVASKPYAVEITRVLTALASNTNVDHPLLVERPEPKRVGVLVVTSDRGLAGGYSSNALKTAGELMERLKAEGKTPVLYVIGRKGVGYYKFRGREIEASWTGFSENPTFADAREVGDLLVQTFLAGNDDTVDGHGADGVQGVDELHIVYTRFVSMLTQTATAVQFAPLEVTEATPEGPQPAYEFEPEPGELLHALLPKYLNTRIYAALLESAASESAARRQAMKSATDNAEELVKTLKRQANQARQGEITQEISEIVGGANALAATGSDD
jgi:F-type H+-transporting ATPase subunit gamma